MKLEERLIKGMARTCIEYDVLAPNDRILVAVSGGKDSYCLLYLLDKLRPRMPFEIELLALHVSQRHPGFNNAPLDEWLKTSGIEYEIVEQDIYSVVKRNIKAGQTACSVCSRMRRGILYTWAAKRGCNKIALGHHREDTLATLLLNLFYAGKIQAMPAKYRTNDGRFEVVRPLVETAESDLKALAQEKGFPIVPCVLCSGQEDHKRKKMEELMNDLEKNNRKVKQVMLGALSNVRPTHLLDKGLKRI